MGLQARLMSQALRKLTSVVARSKTTLIFINQLRQKIGVMFGNPETTPGGLALKFYASVRLDIRRIENLKVGDQVIGTRVRVKVVKNKVAPPYRQCEFEMLHGEGISKEGALIDMGVEGQIVEKVGTWFLYKGERLGQGRENAKAYLKQFPKAAEEIEKALRLKYLNVPDVTDTPGKSAEAPVAPPTGKAADKAEKAAEKKLASKH
jgi:recombination protein RecA